MSSNSLGSKPSRADESAHVNVSEGKEISPPSLLTHGQMILWLEGPQLQRFCGFPVEVHLCFHIREIWRWEGQQIFCAPFGFLLSSQNESQQWYMSNPKAALQLLTIFDLACQIAARINPMNIKNVM
jgi:hypothetical protein